MQPDLVLAGTYTARASVRMLERLGIRVETIAITSSLAQIPTQITEMGRLLGQPARAAELVASYEADLAALQANVASRPRAAIYQANGYTSGDRSLAGEILAVAGFDNVASEAGFAGGGAMPLEVLAMTAPDAVIQSARYDGGSRAEAIMDHPVVAALRNHSKSAALTDHDWVCGTPFVLRAIAEMADLRKSITASAE